MRTAGLARRTLGFAALAAGLAVALFGLGGGCRTVDPFDAELGGRLPARGAVVAEHRLAVKAGIAVLDAGGNAADAAVAAALALAVVYPQAGNLGGGGFAVWVPREGDPWTLDFREKTPAAFTSDLYLDAAGNVVPERSLETPLAVGVPGTPAGLYELYRRFGSQRLSFADLCVPAIGLAGKGFFVDAWLVRDLVESGERMRADPVAAERFFRDGAPLDVGERLVQFDLAQTLERFARGGAAGFYAGETATKLLATLARADERAGGVSQGRRMTAADLRAYTVVERPPLIGWFRGNEVITMGPPSSGGVVLLQALAVLDGFPLDSERERALAEYDGGDSLETTWSGLSPRAVHWWIEALRRGFADRAQHLGDPDDLGRPDFVPVPTAQLLSPEWIARRRISIGAVADPNVAPWARRTGRESSQTTHLSVIDSDGNAVSLTTTLNSTFGSGIMVAGAGFLLNNELDDLSIKPGAPNQFGLVGSRANQLVPGRRPLSSMTPTVVRESGRGVSLVLGSPGGPRIITAVTQVLLRVLVYGEGITEAVAAPRLHQQWKPAVTQFEQGWPQGLLEALGARHGQPVQVEPGARFGSVQALQVLPDGRVVGVSDGRRGGVACEQGQDLPQPRDP